MQVKNVLTNFIVIIISQYICISKHHTVYLELVVQLLSHVRLFATPWTTAHQAFLSFTFCQSLPKLMPTESVLPFPLSHLLCHPLLLLPSIFPRTRIFSNELALHIRWPTYWNLSISPFNEYSGLISFRIDWFDLLAVQGTLKGLRQHHSTQPSLWSSSHIHT